MKVTITVNARNSCATDRPVVLRVRILRPHGRDLISPDLPSEVMSRGSECSSVVEHRRAVEGSGDIPGVPKARQGGRRFKSDHSRVRFPCLS